MEKPLYPYSDDEEPESGEDVTVLPGLSAAEGISKLPFDTRSHKTKNLHLGEAARKLWVVLLLITYLIGLGSGFMVWGRSEVDAEHPDQADMEMMAAQINPVDGYELPARYGKIGPKLLEVGAININEFRKIYQESGRPLSEEQITILTTGSMAPIIINRENQHFLLNLFWAFGLANQNRVLTEGPMMGNGEKVVNFASTGGWS